MTITVTNVNEAPVVTGDDAPSFQEDSTTAIATYTATDPERDTLTWSVSGSDGNDFWISSRGQLYFSSPPNFEGQTNRTQVTVTATDDDATTPLLRLAGRDRHRDGRGGRGSCGHHPGAGLGERFERSSAPA